MSFSASWQAVRGWVPAQRPQGWMRMMLAGVMLFICGETLWLFEEFFNGFNGFVHRRPPKSDRVRRSIVVLLEARTDFQGF